MGAAEPALYAVVWLLQGGRLVSGIETDGSGAITALVSRDAVTGAEERHQADAVVFAISIAGKRCAVLCCSGGVPHLPAAPQQPEVPPRHACLGSPQACSAWCRPILRSHPAGSSATSWTYAQVGGV